MLPDREHTRTDREREKLGAAVVLVYTTAVVRLQVHVARAMPTEQQLVPGSSLSRCWYCYLLLVLVRRTVLVIDRHGATGKSFLSWRAGCVRADASRPSPIPATLTPAV